MERCFAMNKYGDCLALRRKKCNKCKFYRTDISMYEIEEDIRRYSPEGKKDDYSILL